MNHRLFYPFLLATVVGAAIPREPLRAQQLRADAAAERDTVRLSIVDAVTRALRESDEARIAGAQVEVADAQVTTARAAGLPQARLAASYSQVLRNARADAVNSLFRQNFNYNSNINVSQVLFQGGRIFAGARAASDVRGASRLTVAETQAQLSVDVQRAYLNGLLQRELEAIQQRNLDLANERIALVEKLLAAGRASRYDALRARVERTNLEPALLQSRNARELADIELRRILNIPAARPLSLTSEIDTAALRAVVQGIARDSSPDPTRPSERAAQLTVNARSEGVRVARADLLPTVSAFFQTGYLAFPAGNGFPTIWGRSSHAFCAPGAPASQSCQNNGWFADRNFGFNVSWPLFDGLRAKGAVDLAQAQEKIARLQLAQQREMVGVERARARAEYQRAEAAFDAQRENVSQADEAFRIANLRFERGLATQLEVSDAQFLLLTARTNAARATIDYYLAAAELARARGVDIPLPPTRPTTR
ncbi:MAG: TolC family protein [Gemmatimonadaceae bacterium]|nr:TolC family protein [Gemmatimonadaceae bacterium]